MAAATAGSQGGRGGWPRCSAASFTPPPPRAPEPLQREEREETLERGGDQREGAFELDRDWDNDTRI